MIKSFIFSCVIGIALYAVVMWFIRLFADPPLYVVFSIGILIGAAVAAVVLTLTKANKHYRALSANHQEQMAKIRKELDR